MNQGFTIEPSRAADAPRRGRFRAVVVKNQALCRAHYRLTLRVPGFPPSEPGQFVQLLCPLPSSRDGFAAPKEADSDCGAAHEWQWTPGTPPPRLADPFLIADRPYLRRPYSIAGCQGRPAGDGDAASETQLEIMHRVIGRATVLLEKLRPGDVVSLLGPLGRGFVLSDQLRLALLIGGGVGIPPMLYLAGRLAQRGVAAIAFCGAQQADLLPLTLVDGINPAPDHPSPRLCLKEFAGHGIPSVVTTDDGSLGMRGLVTTALKAYLLSRRDLDPASTILYCCGPTPMMKAVAGVATEFQLPCQAALEQPMACGMGTCQSCVIKYRPAGQAGWIYKLTCTDGPVFHTADIIWP